MGRKQTLCSLKIESPLERLILKCSIFFGPTLKMSGQFSSLSKLILNNALALSIRTGVKFITEIDYFFFFANKC